MYIISYTYFMYTHTVHAWCLLQNYQFLRFFICCFFWWFDLPKYQLWQDHVAKISGANSSKERTIRSCYGEATGQLWASFAGCFFLRHLGYRTTITI